MKTIQSALISVFHKEGLEEIIPLLQKNEVKIYSTGGTQKFIESLGAEVSRVEDLTSYPSILGGRVKTLHPKIFGGILGRNKNQSDLLEMEKHNIPPIDLVIVDLYPFEETVLAGKNHEDIIEKIDIGGISLIRAAAKNYNDCCVISNQSQYERLVEILKTGNQTSTPQRKLFALEAFQTSSHYDTHIQSYFSNSTEDTKPVFKYSEHSYKELRYGENPHQKGIYYGDLNKVFTQLHGKELSYNNLLDIDASLNLMKDLESDTPTAIVMKHTNACGVAKRNSLCEAWEAALAGDPVSAFGGILTFNKPMDFETAKKVNTLFCEVVIAPSFESEALELLKSKKNRVLLKLKKYPNSNSVFKNLLGGVIWQDKDEHIENKSNLTKVTNQEASNSQINDLLFANIVAKHTKSNTIVLAKNNQLLASGTGQTSRVDALNQAIHKAKSFNFELKDAVMASDAFFPFPDCVEIASKEGINAIIQPGGSIKDNLSIDYCNKNKVAMYTTGTRHFKH